MMTIKMCPPDQFGRNTAVGYHAQPADWSAVELAVQNADKNDSDILYLYVDSDQFKAWLQTAMADFAAECKRRDESEESDTAQYMDAVGFGSEDIYLCLSRIENKEMQTRLELQLIGLPTSDAVALVRSITDLVLLHSDAFESNEILSMDVGEIEHEIPNAICLALSALPESEWRAICDTIPMYMNYRHGVPNEAYNNMSDCRWSLVLNETKARQVLGIN
jgi:hypothetical protein